MMNVSKRAEKKMFFICMFSSLITLNIYAMSVAPGYVPKGLAAFASLTYETVFDSDNNYFTWDILEVSLFPPSSEIFGAHWGIVTQFSTEIHIFDLYIDMGITVYPFKKYLSFSGNFGFNYFFMLLNHFSYFADIKMNLSIPIYKNHHITMGTGLRHRNAVKIIDWANLHDDFYHKYNGYFFEIGYRYIIR